MENKTVLLWREYLSCVNFEDVGLATSSDVIKEDGNKCSNNNKKAAKMKDGRENVRKDSEIRVLIFWKMWLCIGRDDDENNTF